LERFERWNEAVTGRDVIFQKFGGRAKITTVRVWSYEEAKTKEVVRGLVLRWIQKLEQALGGLRSLVATPSFCTRGRNPARIHVEPPSLWVSPLTVFKFGRSE
jgi:hypothetical protein